MYAIRSYYAFLTAGGCHVPSPIGRTDGGSVFGQYSRRGDAFFEKRSNEEALDAYEHALAQGGLEDEPRRHVERQRADTLFRLRRYPEAAAAYAALPPDDEAEIEKARSDARSGDVPSYNFV